MNNIQLITNDFNGFKTMRFRKFFTNISVFCIYSFCSHLVPLGLANVWYRWLHEKLYACQPRVCSKKLIDLLTFEIDCFREIPRFSGLQLLCSI